MKKYTFFLLLLIHSIAYSQTTLDATVSGSYYAIQATQKYYFSNVEKEQSLIVKVVEDEICLLLFDHKQNKHIKKNIINTVPNGFSVKNVCQVGKKYYCFMYFWDGKNTASQFFAQEIDFDNCTFKGDINKIIEIKEPVVDAFTTTYSRDSSKLLIHAKRAFKNMAAKNIYDEYFIHVLDEDMQILNSGKVTMPYTQTTATLLDYTINTENVPFFLFLVPNPDYSKENKKYTPNYTLELLRFDLQKSSITITKITHEENKYIQNVKLVEQPRNNIISCIGLYSKFLKHEENYVITHGFFTIDIAPNGDIKDITYAPYEIDKEKNSIDFGLENIVINKIFFSPDNTPRIVLEQFYYNYGTNSSGVYVYTYYHKDIFVAKMNKKKSLDWMIRLKKNQMGGIASRCGFAYTVLDNKHFFTFFDNPKNEKLQADEDHELYHTQKHQCGSLVAYSLNDETNEIKHYTILNAQKVKSNYQLNGMEGSSILTISNSYIILELLQKKQLEAMLSIKVK